jgi:hypothetical protein
MGLLSVRASMVESISLSEKMLQASAEVLPATPHVSTLFWGTSAELLAVIDQHHRARYGGPCGVCA